MTQPIARIASRPRPAPAPPRPTTSAAEVDDLGGAFDTPPPAKPTARTAPPAPARRPIAGGQRPAPAPTRPAPAPASILQKYGSKGMPHEQAQTVGLKGSEVYGAVGAGKVPPAPKRAPSVQDELGPEYARVTAARAIKAANANQLARPINTTDEAVAYLTETNEVEVPDYQTLYTRDYCYRLVITDAAAMVTMARDVLSEQVDNLTRASIGAGAVDSPALANAVIERAVEHSAGATAALTGDPFGDDIFGGGPTVGVVDHDAATYLFPSGVKLTLGEFRELLLRYARAPLPTQGKMDKNLGYDVGKNHGSTIRAIKGENQEPTKAQMAHQLALQIIAAIQATQPPPTTPKPGGPPPTVLGEDGAEVFDEDFADDGSEPEPAEGGERELTYEPLGQSNNVTTLAARRPVPGRVGQAPTPPATDPRVVAEDAREQDYGARKKDLQNRSQALVCAHCMYPATRHKKLAGEVMVEGQQVCEGFMARTDPDYDGIVALMADADKFREEFPDLIERDKAALKAKGVAADAGTDKSGDVRGGPAPAGSGVGQLSGAAGRAGQQSRVQGGAVRGRDTAPAQGPASGSRQGGHVAGGGGGPEAGAAPSAGPEGDAGPQTPREFAAAYNLSPPEVKAAYDQQRREWAATTPGLEEVMGRLMWDINYPHGNGIDYNLPAPASYAVDERSVERRNKVINTLLTHFDKAFFTGGQLDDNIEYGSVSWRVFVAATRLARAVEDYVTARTDKDGEDAWNKVKRFAKGFVDAHRPAGEEAFDPDVSEYVAWLAETQRPFGTAIEELMGQ